MSLSVPERTLEARNYLKFRCRLDSAIGADAHREFTGCYYPRWRSIYLDEIREVNGRIKLYPVFELAVMYKANGDYFYAKDFVPGVKLTFGKSPYSRDGAPKTHLITFVDDSHLYDDGDEVFEDQKGVPQSQYVVAQAAQLIKEAVVKRSGSLEAGVKDAGRLFREADASGVRRMDRLSFDKFLADLQFDFPRDMTDIIFSGFDTNADGDISYDEFITALRGPMSEARKRAVIEAFTKIDTDRDGFISPKEMAARYQAKVLPEVANGSLTETQALNAFLLRWDTREPNGRILYAEFCDYYNGLSASFATDDEFVAFVRASWK